MLQTMVTINPSTIYTGEPILTFTSSGETMSGNDTDGPSSMSGEKSNYINKTRVVE